MDGGGFSSGGGDSGGGGFSSGGGGTDFGGGGFSSGGGGTDFGGGGFSSGGGGTDFGGGGFSYGNSGTGFGTGFGTDIGGPPPNYSDVSGHSTSGVGYVHSPHGGHVVGHYPGGVHGPTYTNSFGQPMSAGTSNVTYLGGAPTTVYQPARPYNNSTCAKPIIIFFIIFCVVFVILAIIIPVVVVSTAVSNFND